jgi:hypothetical protein
MREAENLPVRGFASCHWPLSERRRHGLFVTDRPCWLNTSTNVLGPALARGVTSTQCYAPAVCTRSRRPSPFSRRGNRKTPSVGIESRGIFGGDRDGRMASEQTARAESAPLNDSAPSSGNFGEHIMLSAFCSHGLMFARSIDLCAEPPPLIRYVRLSATIDLRPCRIKMTVDLSDRL